ncbi:MAG: PrsW family intramembrane metalloprotease [Candidatus Thermoplasmatota archaeon]|nr:PrsW family intramembrane metalloprotease [Candidatus Thermoplasmatota archaeon]
MLLQWVILILLAFIPPVVYTIWIRNTERYHREPWLPVLVCFAWGATIAVIASLVLEQFLGVSLAATLGNASLYAFAMAVVVAPVVEEFTKPLALRLDVVRRELDEIEDGFIYGAAAGLGFSATENLFYEISFLEEGLAIFVTLVVLRTIGACLLHASATALTGYGYSCTLLSRRACVLRYFGLAILVHAAYNFLVSFQVAGVAIGVAFALFFSISAIWYIRGRIRAFDRAGA